MRATLRIAVDFGQIDVDLNRTIITSIPNVRCFG
jgi:hypothetical protein